MDEDNWEDWIAGELAEESGFCENYEHSNVEEGYYDDVQAMDFLDMVGMNHELADCTLCEDSLRKFLAPPQETWKDYSTKENPAVLTIDSAKDRQWELTKVEIREVMANVIELLGCIDKDGVKEESIFNFIIGPKSKVGKFLCTELGMNEMTYLKFLHTLLIQAAYKSSSEQLFMPLSRLRDCLLLKKGEYNGIWKIISEKKRLSKTQMSTSRRPVPLWQTLETHVNELLVAISITNSDRRISIALDDDKIWMNISRAYAVDLFNLKYTTHVRPNRKGIIAHTAISTGANIPLGIVFERTKDSTMTCFKRLIDFMFSQSGQTNLRNVSIHSDRGYMLPNLVFEYLVSSGAEVLGTIKRMAQCWPFTFKQKLREGDKRTLVDTKGAPSLFLKWCKAGAKYVFTSAFRNGTDSVATAFSTIHDQFQWEGIVLKPNELQEYKNDSSSLVKKFFNPIPDLFDNHEASDEEKAQLQKLLDNEIVPFTLRQCKNKIY